jgi:hypothetical protein
MVLGSRRSQLTKSATGNHYGVKKESFSSSIGGGSLSTNPESLLQSCVGAVPPPSISAMISIAEIDGARQSRGGDSD